MEPNISINILRKNDKVLSVYSLNESINIVVKHEDESIDIFIIGVDENNMPRINGKWAIAEGEEEIVVEKKDSNIKVTTF